MRYSKTATSKFENLYKNDIKNMKKERPWYATNIFSIFALIILATIDFSGFLQGGLSLVGDLSEEKMTDLVATYISTAVMLTGFTAAFEGSTIYMAYAFMIKLYNYDKAALLHMKKGKKHRISSSFISTSSLGWISLICFMLGVIANSIFRVGLYYYKTCGNDSLSCADLSKEKTLMIVMILLPIITSILNFVISCFSFDPLLFELNKIGKQIAILNSQNEKIKNNRLIAKTLLEQIKNIRADEEYILAKEKTLVATLRPQLRTGIYEHQMKGIT